MSRSSLLRSAVDRGWLLALITLVLFVWIAPAHVVYGDNAEFSALGVLGGTAHPSGYPLYVLWLRLWSWLPVDSPAHAASIATGILTALEVLVLHAACRAWGARPLAATFAVGLLAASPIVLRVQSEAEVFALNGLVCGAVVWLAATAGPLRGPWRVAALGLVAGLGMSNHLTCVLLAPVGLLGVVRGLRESRRHVVVGVGLAMLGLAVGLLPYAYLLVAPNSWVSWSKIDNLGDLVRHFLRMDYGGPGQFAPIDQAVPPFANLIALIASLGRAYLWLPAAVGLGALGVFSVRRASATGSASPSHTAESRIAWALLATSFVVAGPALVLRFNLDPTDINLYVVQRFHLMSMTLLVVPVAVGVDRLVERGVAWIPAKVIALSSAAVGLGLVVLAATSLPYVARMHSPAIEQGLENLLHSLPEGAIVIGSTDIFHGGLGYLQGALGERRDVAAITTVQLGLPSARERVRQRTGIELVGALPGSEDKLSVKLAELALATGRPVFIDPYQANIAKSFPVYPYGLLFRVLPHDTPLPPILEVFAINKRIYSEYRFGYAFPGMDDQLATDFHAHYARTWRLIAPALASAGRREELAFAQAMIAELEPADR